MPGALLQRLSLTDGTAIAVHVVVEVAVVARSRRELKRGRHLLGERAVRGGVGGHILAQSRAGGGRQEEPVWRRGREAERGAEARQRHRGGEVESAAGGAAWWGKG